MAFRLRRTKPLRKELSRVVTREFTSAIDEIASRSPGSAEAVHQARKHIKKTRAVLRLFEKDLGGDYTTLTGPLRTAAHQLSSLRDLEVSVETMKAVRDHYPRVITPAIFRGVDRALVARHRETSDAQRDNVFAAVARELERSKRHVPVRVRRVAAPGGIRAGIRRGYRRARKAMAQAGGEPEDLSFHAWRRRVKEHWYHMRLLEGLDRRAHGRVRRLKQLETCLGDEHNLVVLRGSIVAAPERFGGPRGTAVVLGCIDKFQAALRRRALKEGERLFAPKPSDFREALDRWWPSGRASRS